MSALFGSWTLGASGVDGIIFWPHRTRRGPPRRHFGVARFQSGEVRRGRFALHHLWKKIPRRRSHLRGAKARTAKIYAVVIFSEEKDGIPVLLKYFGSLSTRWRIDSPMDFVRQRHPQGRTLCGRLLLPFGSFGFQIPGRSPFPPPVVFLHGDARSLG